MSEPRFLIVKFSAIGDCVMAVPVASAIRRTYPNAFIAWAVDPRCAAVVDTQRLVDLRFAVPREDWKRRKTPWWSQYRHFVRLRQFKFHFGLDLQGHSKTALCLRIANPEKRIASRATDAVARVLNPLAPERSAPKHVVDRNLQVLHLLGEFEGGSEPIMPEPKPSSSELAEALAAKDLITISVSTGHPKKCYPLEKWIDVAQRLKEMGYTVAFLGGDGDPQPNFPGASNWVGKLALADTIAAVAASRVHLAADTGTGHIAAAYGVPTVSIFGFTDVDEYRPYAKNVLVLNAGKDMNLVEPRQVVDAADSLLEERRDAVLS